MGVLEGRVAVITGAGRGIGREHALLFAREGANVVVNDLGGGIDGNGADRCSADVVVDECLALGASAIANREDVSSFAGAGRLIGQAIDAYGHLDVLVNNAGILRDAYLHQMTEAQWDAVIGVHLKGHFSTLRHAADHWKRRAKRGETVMAAVINTASASGTWLANPGQANYGAAKAGIAALTLVAASELGRYGVRVNAIAPFARTRMSEGVPVVGEIVKPPAQGSFDAFHPRHVSPLVAYLTQEGCPVTGKLFAVQGGLIAECGGWQLGERIETDREWRIEMLDAGLGRPRSAA
jgi:NAD(P)-dependent dehydrogenase (short-subunit alcohol dehydrogenase family)